MKYINENPTKTEKILFERYGLYLIYKDEDYCDASYFV